MTQDRKDSNNESEVLFPPLLIRIVRKTACLGENQIEQSHIRREPSWAQVSETIALLLLKNDNSAEQLLYQLAVALQRCHFLIIFPGCELAHATCVVYVLRRQRVESSTLLSHRLNLCLWSLKSDVWHRSYFYSRWVPLGLPVCKVNPSTMTVLSFPQQQQKTCRSTATSTMIDAGAKEHSRMKVDYVHDWMVDVRNVLRKLSKIFSMKWPMC